MTAVDNTLATTLRVDGMSATEGDQVARQVELPDGTTVEAGTVAEAAALIGVTERTYRAYEREERSPVAGVPAPGPFQVRDPQTSELIYARDPASGATLRNLTAVREWQAQRGAGGRRAQVTASTVRATPWRVALLEHATAGRLAGPVTWADLAMPGAGGEDTPGRRAARVAQAAAELAGLDLLEKDAAGGYVITESGRKTLSRFRKVIVR